MAKPQVKESKVVLRLLFALSIISYSAVVSAADLRVIPFLLSVGSEVVMKSGLLPALPPMEIQWPVLPTSDNASPVLLTDHKRDRDFDFDGRMVPQMLEMRYLNYLPGRANKIKVPGLDGLPIKNCKRMSVDLPAIPGLDGLPIGAGRR